MRDFACPNCGQQLAFENSVCLNCMSPIGFDLVEREFAALNPQGVTSLAPERRMCANLNVAGCNWLVPTNGGPLCRSCSLTRTRPNDGGGHELPIEHRDFATPSSYQRALGSDALIEAPSMTLPVYVLGRKCGLRV